MTQDGKKTAASRSVDEDCEDEWGKVREQWVT